MAEKESGSSPLSQFVAQLRLRAQQRSDSMVESSVLVGAESSVFTSRLSEIPEDEVDEEEAEAIFSSSWLLEKKSKVTMEKPTASKKRHHEEYEVEGDEDLVENLVLSLDGREIQDKTLDIEVALGRRIRLTQHLLQNYLKGNAFYKVFHVSGKDIDADQRITHDVEKLTTDLSSLVTGMVHLENEALDWPKRCCYIVRLYVTRFRLFEKCCP